MRDANGATHSHDHTTTDTSAKSVYASPNDNNMWIEQKKREAIAHSHGLRHQLRHGLPLLTDDHPLCQWDGQLLPLENIDHKDRIKHGTLAGYAAHYRYQITMCEPCRLANIANKHKHKQ